MPTARYPSEEMQTRNLEEARATTPLTGHYAQTIPEVVMEAMRFLQGHAVSDVGGVARETVVRIAAGLQIKKDLVEKLFSAIERGDHRGLEELVRSSPEINLNAENPDGTTPLLLAVVKRDARICEILLKHGARPDELAVLHGQLRRPREAVQDSAITKLFERARCGELGGGVAVTTALSPSVQGGPVP